MKIDKWSAIVLIAGIVAAAAMIVSLAIFAHMDSAALIGLIAALSGLAATLPLQLAQRKQLAQQDQKIDTITAQTNGLSDRERNDIAVRAAKAVVDGTAEPIPVNRQDAA